MGELKRINQFALSMLNAANLDDLLWAIAENIGKILEFDDCVIYLRDGNVLRQKAAFGIKNPKERDLLNEIVIPVGKGIVGTVALTKASEIVPDTKVDKRYIWDEYSGRSELTVPVVYEGKVIAIFDSESDRVNGYSESDREFLQMVANIAAPRIASQINYEDLRLTKAKLLNSNKELKSSLLRLKQNQESLIHSEKMASIGVLAAGVAHEINNPLGFSLSNISYLRSVFKDVKNSHEMSTKSSDLLNEKGLKDILDALVETECGLERIKNIVHSLKCYTHNKEQIQPVVDLNESIESALKILKGHLGSQCELSIELSRVPSIAADPNKLQQVLINLVMNAKQALTAGGKICVRTYSTQEFAFFDVIDNGTGIDKENMGKIFTPFYTTKPVGEGTGLGLYICYKIVQEEHKGTIDVSSDKYGTKFSVGFPLSHTRSMVSMASGVVQ